MHGRLRGRGRQALENLDWVWSGARYVELTLTILSAHTLIGAACIALYYRLTIPETPRYTFDIARDIEQAYGDVNAYIAGKPEGQPDEIVRVRALADAQNNLEVPRASWKDFVRCYTRTKNGLLLLGVSSQPATQYIPYPLYGANTNQTAGSWFFLDTAYYGLSLNTPTILNAIGYSAKEDSNVYKFLYDIAVGNLVITLAGAVPGYWVTVALVDRMGRKTIQMMGFIILTL
jgi:MFS transporter, PHS family, inorganic phosphate transporter